MSIRRGVVSGLVVAIVLLLGSAGRAQEISAEAWEELRELQGEILEGRKAIVEENLALTTVEAKSFWPVYQDYRNAREALAKRSAKLIEAYAEHYDSMDDGKAEALLAEWLDIERDETALREGYAAKVATVLPARKTVRFFQIENKLDAITQLDVTLRIPLVE
jgi:hypothetical protein